MLATIALTVGGVTLSSMPAVLVNAAQVLLGCMLGARFDRGFLVAAPRFVAAVMVSVTVTLALAAQGGRGVGYFRTSASNLTASSGVSTPMETSSPK